MHKRVRAQSEEADVVYDGAHERGEQPQSTRGEAHALHNGSPLPLPSCRALNDRVEFENLPRAEALDVSALVKSPTSKEVSSNIACPPIREFCDNRVGMNRCFPPAWFAT